MFIVDPGIIYRYLWCFHCQSVRFHSLKRRQTKKFGEVWWVRCDVQCFGIAPHTHKRRRMELECQVISTRWIPASQWNVLVGQDSYAA